MSIRTIGLLSWIILPVIFSCNTNQQKEPGDASTAEVKNIEPLFPEVQADFTTQTVVLPKGFTYQVLFSEERDTVVTNSGVRAPARGLHDMIAFIPGASPDEARLYVSHETSGANDLLGDGGGGTVFPVKKIDGIWQVSGDFMAVDFSTVGGTLRNCGGALSPNNTIFTAEEDYPLSNKEIYKDGKGIRDTSDYNDLKRFQNYGWMVEVDPEKAVALRKVFAMGRFMHEDIEFMPDRKTVFLTDDYDPAVLFRFVADKPGDYTIGKLYAYREQTEESPAEWIELPTVMDSLVKIREVAMRMGATIYQRHEWMQRYQDKLFIAETGKDSFDWYKYVVKMGAQPASHLMKCCHDDNYRFEDPYGRILVLNLKDNTMEVFLEGGGADNDPDKVFSNPDCLTIFEKNGKAYLVIHEDLIGIDMGRVGAEAYEKQHVYNEIYFLDLSIPDPRIDDLQRFMMAPRGCETTGGIFSPDGSAFFVNIQHPDRDNPPPFNRSVTIAVTGFDRLLP